MKSARGATDWEQLSCPCHLLIGRKGLDACAQGGRGLGQRPLRGKADGPGCLGLLLHTLRHRLPVEVSASGLGMNTHRQGGEVLVFPEGEALFKLHHPRDTIGDGRQEQAWQGSHKL